MCGLWEFDLCMSVVAHRLLLDSQVGPPTQYHTFRAIILIATSYIPSFHGLLYRLSLVKVVL
jgi:hypothetical protein